MKRGNNEIRKNQKRLENLYIHSIKLRVFHLGRKATYVFEEYRGLHLFTLFIDINVIYHCFMCADKTCFVSQILTLISKFSGNETTTFNA